MSHFTKERANMLFLHFFLWGFQWELTPYAIIISLISLG
jgi:hypothetical protein